MQHNTAILNSTKGLPTNALSPHLHHAVEGDVMLASRKMLKTALTASDVAVMNTLQSGAGWVGQVNPEGVL